MENVTQEEQKKEKVVILGSGPAGLSAALYTARAELEPLVITGMEFGGQAALTNLIENYPGFPDGIQGSQLGDLLQRQAEKFGARIEMDIATKVDLTGPSITIQTGSRAIQTSSLIICTGASPNHLNIPGEEKFTGRGVSYCATCDGWFFKGKNVMVIGGGDSALEEAIFLTRYANRVTIIHRRDTLRACSLLQNRAKENPRIDFIWNSIPTEIIGDDHVNGVKVKNVVSGDEREVATDGVFIFIGHHPNNDLFKDQLRMNEAGYLVLDERMQTSVQGVFAAGESADSTYRQVVTSAGMGAAAGIQAVRFLEARGIE